MADKKRVNVYMTPEVYDQLIRVSKMLGRSYTGVGSLAVQLGLSVIELSKNQQFADMITNDPDVMGKLERMVGDVEKTDGSASPE